MRYKLDVLEESGLIKKGSQAIAAVHIDRHDRRPVVYDLQLIRGANPAPNTSINHQVTEQQLQREISDVVAEQDGRALRSTDSRQRFSMFAEWAYASWWKRANCCDGAPLYLSSGRMPGEGGTTVGIYNAKLLILLGW